MTVICHCHRIFSLIFVLFSFALHVQSSSSASNHRQTIERVREHLRQSENHEEFDADRTRQTDWLENSNKIGIGYNPLSGTPVCYTGACQMAGFTRAIVKLNYTSPSPGACTSQLIPDHVELDCIPSTSLTAASETISTIEQLKKSITDKVELAVSVNVMAAAFSYSFSKETRYMVDNIFKEERTSIFTKAQVSFAKLSLFEPKMQLSDNFRYVIENMPCCVHNDTDTEEYIHEFIFEYFGFTYMTSILLGGIAQENILINRKSHEQMETAGVNTQHQAQVSFQLKFGASASTTLTNAEETNKFNSFMSQVHSTHSTTLGGRTDLTTLPEWSRTVSSNPVIVQFTIRDIMRLLTNRHFPNDPFIATKSLLIKWTLEKYLQSIPTYCYNDCGGKNGSQGTCISLGHFHVGECRCKPEWTGLDCSVPTIKKNQILHGTICGFDRSFIRVNCEGLKPFSQGCPSGWVQKIWKTDLTVCFKNGMVEAKPVVGTLCGLYATYDRSKGSSDIPCNNKSLNTLTSINRCPLLYQNLVASNSASLDRNNLCYSQNAPEDLPGTICGMQIENTVDGPTCDGNNPGLRQCPDKYAFRRTVFNSVGYLVCVKE